MGEYEIELDGVTYTVTPLIDDGDLYAVIHAAKGLEEYGSEDLPSLFDMDTQARLSQALKNVMREEDARCMAEHKFDERMNG